MTKKVTMTRGKFAAINALADERGIIAAAAMDQRGSLKKAIAKEAGREIGTAELVEFKSLVTEILTPYATGVLLDPEYGLEASERRAKGSGLLLAYEKTGYDATVKGRLPDLLSEWSVHRLSQAGANAIKILLNYDPEDEKWEFPPGSIVSTTKRQDASGSYLLAVRINSGAL